MALTNDQITAQNFKDFYGQIRPYLNGTAHGGFTPIGTVISVMGKQAPHNYLVCDGTVYNIADYPELAAYFVGQFEASNFFGGDGITTFAVPDLRGEFLRGAGTNSHTNQGNGAEVGIHQDGTEHLRTTLVSATGEYFVYSTNDQYVGQLKQDSLIGTTTKQDKITGTMQSVTQGNRYTSRPTNTSVLYCIATKNIFMDAGSNYSTDELVVGTWIDGKPIYQKTFTGLNITPISGWMVVLDISALNPESLIDITLYNIYNNTNMYTIKTYEAIQIDDKKIKALNIPSTAGNIHMITVKYTKSAD